MSLLAESGGHFGDRDITGGRVAHEQMQRRAVRLAMDV